jgi:hypothetical protein
MFNPCGQLIKHHAIKAYGGGRYSSIILDRGSRWRWVVSLTLRLLRAWGKKSQYNLNWRLSKPENSSRRYGVAKNLLYLPKIESQLSTLYTVAIPAQLSQLRIELTFPFMPKCQIVAKQNYRNVSDIIHGRAIYQNSRILVSAAISDGDNTVTCSKFSFISSRCSAY